MRISTASSRDGAPATCARWSGNSTRNVRRRRRCTTSCWAQRNRKWLPKIEALLDEERDYLVLVGTLHFVGQDGLLELLTRAGHKPVALSAKASDQDR